MNKKIKIFIISFICIIVILTLSYVVIEHLYYNITGGSECCSCCEDKSVICMSVCCECDYNIFDKLNYVINKKY